MKNQFEWGELPKGGGNEFSWLQGGETKGGGKPIFSKKLEGEMTLQDAMLKQQQKIFTEKKSESHLIFLSPTLPHPPPENLVFATPT